MNKQELRKRDAASYAEMVSDLVVDKLLVALYDVGDDRLTALANNVLDTCEGLRAMLANDPRSSLRDIIKQRSFMKGEFTLASGRSSNFFFNLKPTMLDPRGSSLIGELVYQKLQGFVNVEAIGGLAVGAVPIVSVVCSKSYELGRQMPGFYVRKAVKDHGTERLIEGVDVHSKLVALIEDVSTTGVSLLEAAQAVREAGGQVSDAITVVDRLEGARETLSAEGITLHSIYTREEF